MSEAVPPNSQAAHHSADQELASLAAVSQILSSTLELREAFGKMMQVISEKTNMRRGTLVLLDESTGLLRTEAAVGLTADHIEKNRFALGEGITGNVVATGRARVIPDVRHDPDFLNRTNRLRSYDDANAVVSFLCVPIKIEGRTAGAVAVDKLYSTPEQLKADQTFVEIIAAFLGQAIQ